MNRVKSAVIIALISGVMMVFIGAKQINCQIISCGGFCETFWDILRRMNL